MSISIDFLDAGSSNLALAAALPDVALTVVTNALLEIKAIRPDLYVVGANGVDLDAGITAGDVEEAEFKRRLVALSGATVVLSAADKLGAVAAFRVMPISELTHLVVPRAMDDVPVQAYAAAGAHVLWAAS